VKRPPEWSEYRALIIHQLAREIANITITLELSGESIDEDDVVEILEHLGADLQDLDTESRKILADAFRQIAPEYPDDVRGLVESMAEDFGIEEE